VKKNVVAVLAGIACCILLFACGGGPTPDHNQTSTSGADQVAPPVIPKNANGMTVEQQSIHDRIEATMDPTKVMWNHIIALDGKIIKRLAVRNKVTSSGKRLEPTEAMMLPSSCTDNASNVVPCSKTPTFNDYYTKEIIAPDGTYGSSDPYIFWFDPMGRYHQLGTAGGLGYLLTDYPIDLENPINAITGMHNAHKAASEWQATEEEKLKKQEEQRKKANAEHPKK